MATVYLSLLQILLLMVVAATAVDFNWSSGGRRGQGKRVVLEGGEGERRQGKTGGGAGEMVCDGGASYECTRQECKVSCGDGTEGVLQCTNNAVSVSSNTIGGNTETKVFCSQGTASGEGSDDPTGAASSTDEVENNIPDSPTKNNRPKRPSKPKRPSFPKCFWGTREDGSCKQWKLSIQ